MSSPKLYPTPAQEICEHWGYLVSQKPGEFNSMSATSQFTAVQTEKLGLPEPVVFE